MVVRRRLLTCKSKDLTVLLLFLLIIIQSHAFPPKSIASRSIIQLVRSSKAHLSDSHTHHVASNDDSGCDDDRTISLVKESSETTIATRRSLLQVTALSIIGAASSLLPPAESSAAASVSPSPISASTTLTFIDPSEAQITEKIYVNVRISRQDGTFYVRDDLPDTPENRVFQGKLILGLYGKVAPATVARFLSYIDTSSDDPLLNDNENPMPSYGRSYFTSLEPSTGLVIGGVIPSLQVTEVSGSVALRYGGRLLPAKLWIEPTSGGSLTRASHSRKGLLTHRILDATPAFGITTRSDTRELDRSHTVFGAILLNEGNGSEFLNLVRDFPTYSVERPSSMTMDPTTENVVDDAAEAIFNAQRNFFRSAAKSFGDTRLDKIYEGKILRRIEVTQVGRL